MQNIILYSLPTCAKCAVLRKKMEEKSISYLENQDEELMKQKGIFSCPTLEIDGKLLTFAEAVQWVNERTN